MRPFYALIVPLRKLPENVIREGGKEFGIENVELRKAHPLQTAFGMAKSPTTNNTPPLLIF
jgi:hypothetical protein